MKTKHLILFLISSILFISCQEAFEDNPPLTDIKAPESMKYPSFIKGREFLEMTSSVPFISADGRPVFYEILNVKNQDGILDQSYLDDVTIVNPVESSQIVTIADSTNVYNGYSRDIVDTNNAGSVIIAEGNKFGPGEYYFTIKATVKQGDQQLSTVFEDVLHLSIGPELVTAILYCPVTINLVAGEGEVTDAAEIPFGNANVRFELVSPTDKLQVDPETGSFSLLPSYSVGAPEELKPVVNVISNISEEVVTFEEGFLTIWASNEPITLDTPTNYFFYPSLAANTDDKGYSTIVIEQGANVRNNKVARARPADDIATADRLAAGITGNFYLQTNPVTNAPVSSVPHESWVVMDPQDLTPWSGCFETKLNFYLKNTQTEYLADGRTPADMEIYIASDYVGDVTTATWTQVNDILQCEINQSGDVFTGTPYPGDQTGPDPDGRKDPARNAQGAWTRYELDLAPYLDQSSFTIAFKYATYFEGVLIPGTGEGRSTNFQLSDIFIKAKEL